MYTSECIFLGYELGHNSLLVRSSSSIRLGVLVGRLGGTTCTLTVRVRGQYTYITHQDTLRNLSRGWKICLNFVRRNSCTSPGH